VVVIGKNMGLALRETLKNLRDAERWATLGWTDTSLRYRRTVLGPWWVTLSTGAVVGSVGLVWGAIFGSEMSYYMPFFATGYILWTLISGALTEGCVVFIQAGGLIKSTTTPLLTHVYRMLARQIIMFAHNSVLIVLLWVIIRWPVGWSFLLFLPGLAIVTVALAGAIVTLGILCTRFRDIQQIIGAVLQLLFLLTPIIWPPDSLRGKPLSFLVDFNPMYHVVEVARGPVLGHAPDALVWLAAICSALISVSIGLAMYGRFWHRVAYWL
jgi:ABC-type polysaccharide/polyol phosphate export permease